MSQDDPANFKLTFDLRAKRTMHVLIVIAGDPHPIERTSERFEHAGREGIQPVSAVIIVKIVTQRNHAAGIGLLYRICDPFQRFSAVIRRQELPVLSVETALLKVEVSHQQRAFLRPIQRVAGQQHQLVSGKRHGCERNENHGNHLPPSSGFGKWAFMQWNSHTQRAREWFESLRDQICAAFEEIEREAGSDATFEYTPWQREEAGNDDPGGGVQGLMKGKVFEKVGVNVSTVRGNFSPEFAGQVNGASAENPSFSATGISLVAHMVNPHVPAVHMNTRFLTTGKAWFGGGADLNPPLPIEEDTEQFHASLRAACMAHNPTYYDRFKQWADDYFYIPHRNVHRGVGGIFYDHLECDDDPSWDRNFAFTQDVGKAFLDIYPQLVRKRMHASFDDADVARQLEYRGRYAEFNLVYDRGTLFGLKTGGNIDAILMSLPPRATWS